MPQVQSTVQVFHHLCFAPENYIIILRYVLTFCSVSLCMLATG